MKELANLWVASALLFAGCAGSVEDDDGADTNPTTSATGTGLDDPSATGVDDDPTGADDDPTGADDDPTGDGDSSGGPDNSGMVCVPACSTDEDCEVMGSDIGLSCSSILSTCAYLCDSDEACTAILSGWVLMPCTTNAECLTGICVDYAGDGMGGCAIDATPDKCASMVNSEPTDMLDVDGNMVSVCANATGSCEDTNGEQTCVTPGNGVEQTCEDLGCAEPLVCDDAEPDCYCTTDDDCAGLPSSFDGGMHTCQPK